MNMKQLHVVGGAIRRGDRVLVARRSATMAHPNLWEFPGGKVEQGEDPATALARELAEELSVDARVGDAIGRSLFETADLVITLDVYWCDFAADATPIAAEHSELQWATTDELLTLEWAPAAVPIVTLIVVGTP